MYVLRDQPKTFPFYVIHFISIYPNVRCIVLSVLWNIYCAGEITVQHHTLPYVCEYLKWFHIRRHLLYMWRLMSNFSHMQHIKWWLIFNCESLANWMKSIRRIIYLSCINLIDGMMKINPQLALGLFMGAQKYSSICPLQQTWLCYWKYYYPTESWGFLFINVLGIVHWDRSTFSMVLNIHYVKFRLLLPKHVQLIQPIMILFAVCVDVQTHWDQTLAYLEYEKLENIFNTLSSILNMHLFKFQFKVFYTFSF